MQKEKDALIEEYANNAFAHKNVHMPMYVWRQHFVEFADKLAALSAEAPPIRLPTALSLMIEKGVDPEQNGYCRVIDVEKFLCAKLGKEWSATGMSIISLVEELAAPSIINLNASVRVKLTEHGKIILAMDEYATEKPDENGFIEMQLWRLMRVFGSVMFMGNPNLPFENMNVELLG